MRAGIAQLGEQTNVALDQARLGFGGHTAQAQPEGDGAGVHARALRQAGVFRMLDHAEAHARGSHQRPASRGQPVGDPDRRAGVDQALHDPFRLELAQALGEDPVGDPGDPRQELVEPGRSGHQCTYDSTRPSLAYELDGPLKGRAVVQPPDRHGDQF